MAYAGILIVEDEVIIAEGLRKRLETLGYNVVGSVRSGEEAVEKACGRPRPDLVLMDIMLKGDMDGIEAAEKIRKNCGLPIVYLTAYADEKTLRRAKITEPFAYLVKPFKEKELYTNIEIALYRHRAERKLILSEERYRNLIEHAGVPICELDGDGEILLLNTSAAEVFGGTPSFYTGELISKVLDMEQAGKALEVIREVIRTGKKKQYEAEITVDSVKKIFALTLQPMKRVDGAVDSVQAVGHDITDIVKIEEERNRINRFEIASTLMTGVAHDFTNYMTSILGNITMARSGLDPDEEPFQHLVKAEKASLWAKDLIDNLLGFSQVKELRKSSTDIKKLLKETGGFITNFSDCTCSFSFKGELYRVYADSMRLAQVVNNIMMNAVQAIPSDAQLSVSAVNVSVGKGDVPSLKKGEYVRIDIADNGPGIEEDVIARIFDPYFSTKENNTGLGLSVAFSIIKSHGGTITAANGKGKKKGAVFSLYLPAMLKEKRDSSAAVKGGLEGKGSLFMVEDDSQIRETVSSLLSDHGYDVQSAASGKEARAEMNELANSGKLPDLILLDVVLPDADGYELCSQWKEEEKTASVPIVFLSGKRAEEDKVLALELGAEDYITKPFMPQEFLARIKAILRRRKTVIKGNRIKPSKDLTLDLDTYEVFTDGKPVELTPTEFKILKLFTSRKGWVFTRDRILDYLWGNEKAVYEKTINVHIRHLRQKLGKQGSHIKAVRGVGYKYE